MMVVLSALLAGVCVRADELSDMRKEIDALKLDVAELKRLVQGAEGQGAETAADRKAGIRKRTEEDRKAYTDEQLREIETLYQSANRDLKSPDAKAALKNLIEKYPKANRTGCAVQYMGQTSGGEEKEKYLKLAIKEFGDCYYGNGVQVGAYARLYLGYYYKEKGKEKEAAALFDEIRKDYPDAVNHKGKRLAELLPK
jgi:TolA-binding protein